MTMTMPKRMISPLLVNHPPLILRADELHLLHRQASSTVGKSSDFEPLPASSEVRMTFDSPLLFFLLLGPSSLLLEGQFWLPPSERFVSCSQRSFASWDDRHYYPVSGLSE
ncbi:HNH endonuclease [Sesbania bispinosa]|nr:HNH endonuclease [Sesbania bispinosa]